VQIISKLSAIMVTMVTTLMRLHSVYQAEDHKYASLVNKYIFKVTQYIRGTSYEAFRKIQNYDILLF